jgi:predicted dehydrogenase
MRSNGRALGLLVVGVGFLGAQRAAAAAASRRTRLVAVCDRDATRASEVARRLGTIRIDEYDKAIADPAVDAVVIATPHSDHAHQVRIALEAGKHVLCEKPLAVDADDAHALASLADARGLRLATGLNHRFYPPVRDALALVASSSLGRIETVRAEIGHKATPQFLASWHADVSRSGGGTLIDNGPHACDLIRSFLGEVASVRGELRNAMYSPHGCEIEAFAHFRGRDGGFAELRSSWILETGYLTIEVVGASGSLRIETAPWRLTGWRADGRRIRNRYVLDRVRERLFRLRYGCERSLAWELDAFAASLEPGRLPSVATGWDGCRITEMIAAVYLAAQTGEEVTLEPGPATLPSARRQVSRSAHA